MIAIIGLSYGFSIRALPLTGGGVAFAIAALGRTHAFIAGWALTLGCSCVVALNASAVTLGPPTRETAYLSRFMLACSIRLLEKGNGLRINVEIGLETIERDLQHLVVDIVGVAGSVNIDPITAGGDAPGSLLSLRRATLV